MGAFRSSRPGLYGLDFSASVATDRDVYNASSLGVSVTVLDNDFRIIRRADFSTLVRDVAVLERR